MLNQTQHKLITKKKVFKAGFSFSERATKNNENGDDSKNWVVYYSMKYHISDSFYKFTAWTSESHI